VALVACTPPAVQRPVQKSAQQSAPAAPPSDPEPAATATSAEQAVQPERNPPGDIPDDQAFITFGSPTGGYQLQVPEGWARTLSGDNVRFVDKFGGVEVTVTSAAQAPTGAAAPQPTGRAVQVMKTRDVRLPGGPAVLVDYASNSEPDAVTAKQIRLENQTYYFFKDGKLASLTMWAPYGADNADQWNLMARSFTWQ